MRAPAALRTAKHGLSSLVDRYRARGGTRRCSRSCFAIVAMRARCVRYHWDRSSRPARTKARGRFPAVCRIRHRNVTLLTTTPGGAPGTLDGGFKAAAGVAPGDAPREE